MMKIQRVWTCKGLPIISTWITDNSYEKHRPFTQVYGVCFTPDDKVLVVKDLEDWIIPGGTPEQGELPEQTLRREIDEEAAVITGIAKMIGCVHNSFPNNPVKSEGESF